MKYTIVKTTYGQKVSLFTGSLAQCLYAISMQFTCTVNKKVTVAQAVAAGYSIVKA